jgi:L-seryl-tRNA(Ser) seleniumtransferase
VSSEDRSNLRLLPAVDRVLNLPQLVAVTAQHGRAAVTTWVRQTLSALRNGQSSFLPQTAAALEALVVQRVSERAQSTTSQRIKKVINGTGIVIHTNLGRAPLAPAAIHAMGDAAQCANVEIDLESGLRGRRGAHVEALCQEVTGAEAALVVNNCAAATLLMLQTLAAGRRVVISRGQLIEIGGSFRLPDVFHQAGVLLHEVGTTNRTRLADYAAAIGPDTAALLRVHPSNYRISGFCETVTIAELARLGKERNIPVIDDVGSGCLYDLKQYGLDDEPVVAESVKAGADLVVFSGDKLLGGPQCGIIVGQADILARLRSNPLARALRVDKLTLAALQATLEIHRAGRAFDELPVLQQLTARVDMLRTRAEALVERLRARSPSPQAFLIQQVESASGGGALPDITVPSWAVAIGSSNPDDVARRLRMGSPAVLSRVKDQATLIDVRTVLPHDEEVLVRRILECSLSQLPGGHFRE